MMNEEVKNQLGNQNKRYSKILISLYKFDNCCGPVPIKNSEVVDYTMKIAQISERLIKNNLSQKH